MKLEIGYNSDFDIRLDKVFYSGKHPLRIVYLSDLHFNAFSSKMADKIIHEVKKLNPDIILLGGDYVDTKKGLVHLKSLLNAFSGKENVFALAGNHDHFFGIDVIKTTMIHNNVNWIEKLSVTIMVNHCMVQIDGNIPDVKKNGADADLNVLCLHRPVDLTNTWNNYHVAFAGHLHGSQCVFWQNKKGLFPGRLFYKWNLMQTKVGDCEYYISKGLGDTLPLRYNCRKELLVVDLEPKQSS